MSDKMPLLGVL